MTRVLSGIQPSGETHLGNYLGALKQWVDFQDRADAFYCVVDLHAITVRHDPEELRRRTLDMATVLLACGIDPDRSTLFVQSHLHEHSELAWLLQCVGSVGEVSRMIQFKEKSEGQGDNVSVGLMTYPVLQAADILMYQADEVPIGEDQRQHIELTRDIAQRFNHRFASEEAPVFTLPKAIHPKAAARVMDLQMPTAKMSKSSDSPKGTVLLLDEPRKIEKKVKSAVTDSEAEVRADRENKAGVTNLLELLSAATGDDIPKLEARYAGSQYGPFKQDVADALVAMLEPIQQRYAELVAAPDHVREVLAKGATKARVVAADTVERARDAMGFLRAV